jgi:hypothetical protein
MKPRLTPATAGQDQVAFVIGPGRSGTTLLYKLLCLHPDVAYISNWEHRLPWLPAAASGHLRLRRYSAKLRHWFQQEGNAYVVDRPLVSRVIPVPVEGEGVYRRSGVPLYPEPDYQPDLRVGERLRSHFARLRQASDAKLLVSKRTANNRRIAALDAIFPQARYISLVRDGQEVAASLARVDWWNDHPLWWDARRRTPAQAVAEGEDMERLCARNWKEETKQISRGLARIPSSRVLAVRFEDLVASPVHQMNEVLDFLGLERCVGYQWALKALKLGQRPAADLDMRSHPAMAMVKREPGEYPNRLGNPS